jgi:hypothetical protein
VTSAVAEKLHELLAASLPAWRIAGEVWREADGGIVVAAGGQSIRITAAPAGTPFRWMVAGPERTRGAASVVGVLRAVRSAIDPEYAPVRLRIAPSPVVPT